MKTSAELMHELNKLLEQLPVEARTYGETTAMRVSTALRKFSASGDRVFLAREFELAFLDGVSRVGAMANERMFTLLELCKISEGAPMSTLDEIMTASDTFACEYGERLNFEQLTERELLKLLNALGDAWLAGFRAARQTGGDA